MSVRHLSCASDNGSSSQKRQKVWGYFSRADGLSCRSLGPRPALAPRLTVSCVFRLFPQTDFLSSRVLYVIIFVWVVRLSVITLLHINILIYVHYFLNMYKISQNDNGVVFNMNHEDQCQVHQAQYHTQGWCFPVVRILHVLFPHCFLGCHVTSYIIKKKKYERFFLYKMRETLETIFLCI